MVSQRHKEKGVVAGSDRTDVLLHPVRLRIVQALMLGEPMTVAELDRTLGDIPQASLYRHLHRLVEAGFLHVVGERPAGGATERIYGVVAEAITLTAADVATASRDDHMRYFTAFCAALMGSFERYLQREPIDLEADRVGYRTVSLWLSDEEFDRLVAEMNEPLQKVLHNKPAPGRRRRLFTSIVMPDADVRAPEEWA